MLCSTSDAQKQNLQKFSFKFFLTKCIMNRAWSNYFDNSKLVPLHCILMKYLLCCSAFPYLTLLFQAPSSLF